MKKYAFLASLIVIIAIYTFSGNHKKISSTSIHKSEVTTLRERRWEVQETKKTEIELQSSFFEIDLENSHKHNNNHLSVLKAGLLSKNPAIYQASIPLVLNILVDVSHDLIQLNPDHEEQVKEIFKLLVVKYPEQINKIKQSNPQSPVLSYLASIKG